MPRWRRRAAAPAQRPWTRSGARPMAPPRTRLLQTFAWRGPIPPGDGREIAPPPGTTRAAYCPRRRRPVPCHRALRRGSIQSLRGRAARGGSGRSAGPRCARSGRTRPPQAGSRERRSRAQQPAGRGAAPAPVGARSRGRGGRRGGGLRLLLLCLEVVRRHPCRPSHLRPPCTARTRRVRCSRKTQRQDSSPCTSEL